jgi:hypothetical protein
MTGTATTLCFSSSSEIGFIGLNFTFEEIIVFSEVAGNRSSE